ncbi:MAG: efflux RND transporter permease subunit [Myxococcota bacterium]|nr:efflux RND transporter permease subunit [Myxococcota bacterium]
MSHEPVDTKGMLGWMANNPVASNLLMFLLVVGGILFVDKVKWEVFPQFELEMVLINIPYPGASPSEVEQGVILAVEEAVREVDGILELRSTASEGSGVVVVELMAGINTSRALNDIKSAVDRIVTLPEDIERPVISLASNRGRVISLVVYGQRSERELRDLAQNIRDDLLEEPNITLAELAAVRPLEVTINVPRSKLREYGLTVEGIARRIREASIEVPSGGIKTAGGEILVRTTERKSMGSEFGDIVLLSQPDGTIVKVGDVATVNDGFKETDQSAFFNGQPAAMVQISSVGDQKPMVVAKAVKNYIKDKAGLLPPGIQLATWADSSRRLEERTELLLNNGKLGLFLVLLSLGLFLNRKLAFWVTLGIPISFLGSVIFLPFVDVSLNMISLFAYIITLGIVVDDAIVVGEAIHKNREDGMSPLQAAIKGAREVAQPVIFAVLTTVIAFTPMLFVPGASGKFFRVIPWVVIIVLLLSLVESLLILPSHLAHSTPLKKTGILAGLDRFQQRFADGLDRFIQTKYAPAIKRWLTYRYATIAFCIMLFFGAIGLVAGERVEFTFLPRVESDRVVAKVRMPFGTDVAETERVVKHMLKSAEEVLGESGETDITQGIFTEIGSTGGGFGSPRGRRGSVASHIGQVSIYLVRSDLRKTTARGFSKKWRKKIGSVAGVESLDFRSSTGHGSAKAVDIRVSHADMHILEKAAEALAEKIETIEGTRDVDDGFYPGKEQLDLQLKPEGRSMGLTEMSLARQLRSVFFGAEALRQQRGRDEVRVYVRLPREERRSEYDIEEIMLRTPNGGEFPLASAANIGRGRAYTSISRVDSRRVVTVSADVIQGVGNAQKIVRKITQDFMPELKKQFPGLTYSLGSEQSNQKRTLRSLADGGIMAMFAMFALLSVAFKSYTRPIIIMLAIPFGLVGAIVGHVVMGYNLSLISMMGIVALSGVVVNDSLILIVAIDRARESGLSAYEAVIAGGIRRFRPILLTSVTTCFGLLPMILESSVQAKFLVPMAISLGFGVLFATVITLILVPAVYLVLDDIGLSLKSLFGVSTENKGNMTT